MARRKSWDELTDKYRERLLRNGIGPAQHAAGAAISKARGKGAPGREALGKRITRFLTRIEAPTASRAVEKQRLMALGPVRAQQYMDYRRKMTRQWETGHYQRAKDMYVARDTSIRGVLYRRRRYDNRMEDATWWYHGIFGG
jgi:hypothetical protein